MSCCGSELSGIVESSILIFFINIIFASVFELKYGNQKCLAVLKVSAVEVSVIGIV